MSGTWPFFPICPENTFQYKMWVPDSWQYKGAERQILKKKKIIPIKYLE